MTSEEQRAVASLRRLASRWPRSLWLFSADGTLYVMRVGEDGRPVFTASGTYDDEYVVAVIDIPNDGGGW